MMSPESTSVEHARPQIGDWSLCLSIQSRLDQIRLVRAAMSGVLSHLGIVEGDIHSLGIAVTEIINNSMEHGYKGDEHKEIKVFLHIFDSEVEVDIIDDAPPFPDEARYRLEGEIGLIEDPSEDWPMRGHGLQMVRNIVDSILLVTENGHNCMKLRKTVGVQKT